jgi:hypothetical protein
MPANVFPLLWCRLGHGLFLSTPPWRIDRCPHCGTVMLPVTDAASHELLDAVLWTEEAKSTSTDLALPIVC